MHEVFQCKLVWFSSADSLIAHTCASSFEVYRWHFNNKWTFGNLLYAFLMDMLCFRCAPFFLHFMPELIYFLFTFHCLCFLFEEEEKWILLKIQCFFKFISNSMRHINRGTSLLIYVSISLCVSSKSICMRIRHRFTVVGSHS